MQKFQLWGKAKLLLDWTIVLKVLSLMFSMLLVFIKIYWVWDNEKGYNMQIHHDHCALIYINGRFVAKVKMTPNCLFPLRIHHEKLSCLSSVIPNDDWLWNMSVGHFYFSGLNYLSRKEFVFGLSVMNIPNGICETCVIGKKRKEYFATKKSWRWESCWR